MGYVNLTHPSFFFHFWLPDSFWNPQEPGFFVAGPLLIPFYSGKKKNENNTTNKKTSTSSTFSPQVPPIASTRWFPVISPPLPLVVLVVLQVPVRHHRGVAAIGVVGVVRGHGLGTLGEVRGWFESPGGGHKPWTKPWHPLDANGTNKIYIFIWPSDGIDWRGKKLWKHDMFIYTYCFKWCKHVWERLKDRPKSI